jgi:predicted AAA+ superfamily ATPase
MRDWYAALHSPSHVAIPVACRYTNHLTSISVWCIIIHIMNAFHLPAEQYYPRWLTPALRDATRDHAIVVVTGARQVGKSTLLWNAEPFRDWRFHTLDDFHTRRQALDRPEELWAGTDRVVLDEVQRAPDLLLAVKQAVDRDPGRIRFVLSGSANLLLMRRVSESLAGRAVYFVLHPMTLGEMRRTSPPDLLARSLDGDWPEEGTLSESPPDPVEHLLRGFMPALLTVESPKAWTRWWDGYVATYLERDLRQLSQIDRLLDFRRVMELAALRTGQLVSQSEIGRDAQISQSTVHRYLNLLETTHLFVRLPAYTVNRTSRLMKSPKSFWSDPALAVFLSGYFEADGVRRARELGAYFETMIFLHLRVLTGLLTPPARLYFWRTRSGREVDFVVEHGRRLLAIEVKRAAQVGYGDVSSLHTFLDEYPEASGGLLLYGGRDVRRLGERVVALPWTMITGW